MKKQKKTVASTLDVNLKSLSADTSARKKLKKKDLENYHSIGLYVRVSTTEQAENPEGSIKSQEQRLRQFVEYKNLAEPFGEVTQVYIDRAKSAKDQNRPALQQMLRDVSSGALSMICVTELSRLTRSIKDFSEIWDFLEKKNCDFLSLREQFDSTSAAGQMVMFSLANIAQFERSQTSERIKANFLARAKRGLFNGGSVPLGYMIDEDKKGYLKIDSESAKIVKEAFKTFLKEESVSATGKSLNNRGFRMKKSVQGGGKGWRHSHFTHGGLYSILTNPSYVGKRKYTEHGEVKFSKACWEPIVDEVTFKKVQRTLSKNHRKNKHAQANRYPYLLSGMVKCGSCEKSMVGKSAHGNSGKVPYYEHGWIARKVGLLKDGKYTCSPHRVPGRTLEPLVWEQIEKLLTNENFARELHKESRSIHRDQGPEQERQRIVGKMKTLEARLEAMSEHLSRLPKSVSPKPIFAQMEKIETEKENEEKKLQILKESGALKETPLELKDYKEFLKVIEKFASSTNDPQIKNKVAKLLIHKVVIFEDEIEIHFRMGSGLKQYVALDELPGKKDRHNKKYFSESKKNVKNAGRAAAYPDGHQNNLKKFEIIGSTTIDNGGCDKDRSCFASSRDRKCFRIFSFRCLNFIFEPNFPFVNLVEAVSTVYESILLIL